MNILEAIDSPHVFGKIVKHKTYGAWRSFLAALFGLPMTDAELELFKQCTGRTTAPTTPFREVYLPTGRRGGKSFTLALIAVYLACFYDYRKYLAPGERASIMIMASDKKQARVIFRYCLGLIKQAPALSKRLEDETKEEINLTNSITIEVVTASHKATRGYKTAAVLLDEIAFYSTEETAASPDTEILNALRPGLGEIDTSIMLCASSPYARKGVLWNAYKRYYGQDKADVLVWQAATRVMNPTFPQRVIDKAIEDDPSAAASEYGAQFRSDMEAFLNIEDIARVTDKGIAVREYEGRRHVAAVDPAGGSGGGDSMTLAISHIEGTVAVLDCLIEKKPPFSTEATVEEFARKLKEYGLSRVTGDRWGGEFCRSAFERQGIRYDLSEKVRSDIYLDFLPLISSNRVRLLDNAKMAAQFTNLERKVGRNGKDSIDHPASKHSHDDLCNVAALALTLTALKKQPMTVDQQRAFNRRLAGMFMR